MSDKKKVLISGGSGFIGSHLISLLSKKGYEIAVLSRGSKKSDLPNVEFFHWDIKKKEIDSKALKNVNYVINMAGANIGSERWTEDRKKTIINSRTESTNFLYESVAEKSPELKCVISASAVGYYGTFNSEKTLTEEDPNGNDFLAEVCRQWEESARQFEKIGARVVLLRQGPVLGKEGEIYQRMAGFAKWGINTAVGSGKQYLPWIYIDDLTKLYLFAMEHSTMTGAFNAVSGIDTNMNDFAKVLAHSLKKPVLTPNAPAFVIKMLFGELSQSLLEGSKVSNKKLEKEGFEFKFKNLEEVLDKISRQ